MGLGISAGARAGVMLAVLLCASCQDPPPPPSMWFMGLPVSGTAADSQRAGFTHCIDLDAIHLRCRRHGVMLAGYGPYEAAIDLSGSRGRSGFDQVTLWYEGNQEEAFKFVEALERRGWRHCETGSESVGDQDVYTYEGIPVRVSMDLSYYGKRRIRFLPPWNHRDKRCKPVDRGRKTGSTSP